jgi:hypothetical protein
MYATKTIVIKIAAEVIPTIPPFDIESSSSDALELFPLPLPMAV